MPIDQLGFTSHFINPSGIPIPMGFVFRFQVQTMNTFNYRKFIKKYRIRLLEKALDMAILIAIGYAFGIHLVRGV